MADWVGRTATQIAAAVRAGEASARAVVAEHLDRIDELNPQLSAFVRVRADAALAEADGIDGRADRASLPLAGVPVAVKDNIPVAGEPMRVGSAATPDTPQEADHPAVARLRAAGAVVVGLTNLPELSLYPFTDSAYGITRNPWNPRRTAGGSSGGSAAAVASAMVPIALGNDGLGSIRIPAAVCGLFGIKPGPGVIPAQIGLDSWGGLAENGPLATTVADAALMFGVLAGTVPASTVPASTVPASTVSASTGPSLAPPRKLHVCLSVRAPSPGVRVNRAFRAAVDACGDQLERLGHTVTDDDPPYPWWAPSAMIERWFATSVADARPLLSGPGLERRTRRHIRIGRRVLFLHPPRDKQRERLRRKMAPFFERYDVLVMPALARPAPAARRWGKGTLTRSVTTALLFSPMAGTWNLAGMPAAAIPAGPPRRGMPVSVQLVAAEGGEELLLALAAQLEGDGGWPRHAPAYDPGQVSPAPAPAQGR
jgi:amidase